MGFLTILNYIAMGLGYMGILLVLIIVLWLLISSIKEKIEMKKWEKERVDEEKVNKILEKEKEQTTESAAAQPEKNNQPSQNNEELVDESGKLKMVG